MLVSDRKNWEYNRIAVGVEHRWNAVIDNSYLATDEEILNVFEIFNNFFVVLLKQLYSRLKEEVAPCDEDTEP
jgi:hypothetical protein